MRSLGAFAAPPKSFVAVVLPDDKLTGLGYSVIQCMQASRIEITLWESK